MFTFHPSDSWANILSDSSIIGLLPIFLRLIYSDSFLSLAHILSHCCTDTFLSIYGISMIHVNYLFCTLPFFLWVKSVEIPINMHATKRAKISPNMSHSNHSHEPTHPHISQHIPNNETSYPQISHNSEPWHKWVNASPALGPRFSQMSHNIPKSEPPHPSNEPQHKQQ